MPKRDKYVVDKFNGDGWFIFGGDIQGTFFQRQEDAELVCNALNMVERLKVYNFKRKLDALNEAATVLGMALTEGTERDYY